MGKGTSSAINNSAVGGKSAKKNKDKKGRSKNNGGIKKTPKRSSSEGNQNIFSKWSAFYNGSISELKKISWATKQETIQATIVTVIIITIVAICLFVLDMVLGKLMLSLAM